MANTNSPWHRPDARSSTVSGALQVLVGLRGSEALLRPPLVLMGRGGRGRGRARATDGCESTPSTCRAGGAGASAKESLHGVPDVVQIEQAKPCGASSCGGPPGSASFMQARAHLPVGPANVTELFQWQGRCLAKLQAHMSGGQRMDTMGKLLTTRKVLLYSDHSGTGNGEGGFCDILRACGLPGAEHALVVESCDISPAAQRILLQNGEDTGLPPFFWCVCVYVVFLCEKYMKIEVSMSLQMCNIASNRHSCRRCSPGPRRRTPRKRRDCRVLAKSGTTSRAATPRACSGTQTTASGTDAHARYGASQHPWPRSRPATPAPPAVPSPPTRLAARPR